MARFRDIKDVIVFGEDWTGVQEVNTPVEGENFDYSADDNTSIRRVDVTKRSISISITVQDPEFKRDISLPVFGSSPQLSLNEVLSATMRENADEMVDSSEDDDWITFVGITRRVVEGEMEIRDFNQLMNEDNFYVGIMGRLQFDVLPGAALTGLANRDAYERFWMPDMVCTGINSTNRHGDLHSGTVNFRGGGDSTNEAKINNTLSAGGVTVFEINAGDEGTISFAAPTADGGDDANISIVNCVCTSVEITATHGGRLERKFTFRAYSDDGETSPLTLT